MFTSNSTQSEDIPRYCLRTLFAELFKVLLLQKWWWFNSTERAGGEVDLL